ncbi:MAG: Ribosomal silencing factor RsfS [Chlamydiae bacterium]|nr:Ribosomal silencing factor RsfS [Chlamydiota bacterium]
MSEQTANIDVYSLLGDIAQTIFDKKGFNITALDVRGISTLTDYFLVGEGNVDKHVIALAKAVQDRLKSTGIVPLHVEGIREGDWVVLDYGEFIVHLFKPGLREKYHLEGVWHEGKILDLPLVLPEQKV